jgi:hypothetical protein
MKKNFLILIIAFFFMNIANAQDTIPKPNAEIVKYVSTVIGQQVDRGECWDIANQALTRINAKWDKKFVYGKLLNPEKEIVYPGDIVQFKNVLLKTEFPDGSWEEETMEQHTAIIYRVITKGEYELAHQNTGFSGRKVGLSTIKLSSLKKGKIYIYRPNVE